ncbi:hypothetical protein [Bacillus benzoevorans]|uniref:hypothetical protein n=1 Tax=Bacillus benzoevorans TaxID=1456 RepID=UPI00160FB3DC|nr:hypothetical protein [Bacillus benzoevorans]
MKRYVVIGFDIREHIVIGKVFEDIEEANEYLQYLNNEMIGKVIEEEHRLLEYAEMHEMDYVPLK